MGFETRVFSALVIGVIAYIILTIACKMICDLRQFIKDKEEIQRSKDVKRDK